MSEKVYCLTCTGTNDHHAKECDQNWYEKYQKLEATLKDAKELSELRYQSSQKNAWENLRLTAEVKRYREALERITDWQNEQVFSEIAKAALELRKGKP